MSRKRQFVDLTIEMVDPKTLKPSSFNPPERTVEKNLTDLELSILEHGFDESQPIVVGKDGELGDGNRRLACALDLGLDKVPVIRSKTMTGAELWSMHNGTVRAPTVKEMTTAVALGASVPGGKSGKWVKWFIDRYGMEMLVYISNKGLSATCMAHVTRVCTYLGEKPDGTFSVAVLKWFAENRGVIQGVRVAMAMGVDPSVIRGAVLACRPLKFA